MPALTFVSPARRRATGIDLAAIQNAIENSRRSFAVRSNRKANLSRQSATVSSLHASISSLPAKRSRGGQIASF